MLAVLAVGFAVYYSRKRPVRHELLALTDLSDAEVEALRQDVMTTNANYAGGSDV